RILIYCLPLLLLVACEAPVPQQENEPKPVDFPTPGEPTQTIQRAASSTLSSEQYYDKVLGLLVGSAIGDAMGAPVEMWDRGRIQNRYGFIDDLIPNVRNASAEGTWKTNLPPGTSTDDTRWKWLMVKYFSSLPEVYNNTFTNATANSFAQFLVDEYQQLKETIIARDGLNPNDLEANVRYLQWLQEWVKVAEAWLSNDVAAYSNAANRFYGGEMACGGMLYAPALALLVPGQSAAAYQLGWDLSIFDIGYAKDISGMTAALTAAAFDPAMTTDSLLGLHYSTDPMQMADSRLIGRIINGIYENALADYANSFRESRHNNKQQKDIVLPAYFQSDTSKYRLMQGLYRRMDQRLQDIAFHANEIYMITLYSLLFADGNFMDAMVFITNYGRDNDTVGAVVGAILGAQLGFTNLPKGLSQKVLEANRRVLNIDLEQLARQMTQTDS
ncbi:MAG: ADP-ribosylglycohydrolase family protein, partial [Bacteroidota bacterium]